MTLAMLFVLGLVLAAVVLFASERFPVDLVALLLMAVLLVSGIVDVEAALDGFSNTATITVGAMFVLSAGLSRTGIVDQLGRYVMRLFRLNFWLALLVMMLVVGALSAFMNNTPVVAIFIPVMLAVSKEIGRSASTLLMPLSFAAMLGGTCTLIGTSTNILVSTLAEQHGQAPLSMFELTPVGLIFFAAGTAYMLLVGVRLIPERRGARDLTQDFDMGSYLTEIELEPDARSVGKTVAESPLATELGVQILEVVRLDGHLRLPARDTVLRAGDVLRVVCNVEHIARMQEQQGIRLRSSPRIGDQELASTETVLFEAVLAPHSTLAGRTLAGARFRETYGATVLAIRHRGELRHERLSTVPLRAGDVLLIESRRDRVEALREDDAFVLVSVVSIPRFRRERAAVALAIVGGVVACASLGLLPIVAAAVSGCVLLVLAGCITLPEAYRAIEWRVIFLLAGTLTLGVALETSGAAVFVSAQLVSLLGGYGPLVLLATFYLMTTALTETMSNNATAVLLCPIAVATANALGVDARPFLVAIAFAASASFMTPVGYQTNTMIYGVGQYRFADFIRVGAPLNLILLILATLLIPRFWPL